MSNFESVLHEDILWSIIIALKASFLACLR